MVLEFCGLGPFSTENKIDFTEFSNEGLFLISGPTGSGKTTIFDAISYCLYGEVSGSQRSKENLRSDFSVPSQKTYVTLSFSHRENEYKVERIPRYERPKLRGEGSTVTKEEATLYMPDGSVVVGFSQVNEEIHRLLGIDYNQFKRLSMLAQGEFQQLLVAKSSERVEIFRSIFQTQIYQKIQKIAKEKSRKVYQELKELVTKMEETSNILGESEQYIEAKLHSDFVLMIEILKNEYKDFSKKEREISLLIDNNREQYMKESNQYEEKKKTKEEYETLQALEKEFFEKLEKLKDEQEENKQIKSKLEKLQKERDEKKDQMARYGELTKQAKQYEELKNNKKKLILEENENKIRIQIAHFKEWKKQDQKLQTQKIKVEKKQEEYQKKEAKWKEEKTLWMEMQSEFFATSVGMIAAKLEEGKPCPVCGSTMHPHKAQIEEHAVTEDMVNAQEETSKAAENQYRTCYEKLLEQTQLLKSLQEQIEEKPELSLVREDEVSEYEVKSVEEETDALQNTQRQIQELTGREAVFSEQLGKETNLKELEEKYRELSHFVEAYDKDKEENQNKIQKHEIDISNTNLQYQETVAKIKKIKYEDISQDELEKVKQKLEVQKNEITELESKKEKIQVAIYERKNAKESLSEKQKKKEKLEKTYGIVGDVDKLLSGDNGLRLTFEQYVLITYFNDILNAANTRLLKMTNGRYEMYRQEGVMDGRKKDNLEIDVLDYYTGKKRSVKTLSGGESFKAALCLALGLSDIVQNNVGGIEIDVLFVDEGFGSLDQESLDQAIEVLMELAGGNRMIGIISHVTELKSRINQQIQIIKKNQGSRVEI